MAAKGLVGEVVVVDERLVVDVRPGGSEQACLDISRVGIRIWVSDQVAEPEWHYPRALAAR